LSNTKSYQAGITIFIQAGINAPSKGCKTNSPLSLKTLEPLSNFQEVKEGVIFTSVKSSGTKKSIQLSNSLALAGVLTFLVLINCNIYVVIIK